jgi:hypothetical protein
MITLSGNFIADIMAYAGTLFTDLSSVVILAIGLPVGFWVISKIIGLVFFSEDSRRIDAAHRSFDRDHKAISKIIDDF